MLSSMCGFQFRNLCKSARPLTDFRILRLKCSSVVLHFATLPLRIEFFQFVERIFPQLFPINWHKLQMIHGLADIAVVRFKWSIPFVFPSQKPRFRVSSGRIQDPHNSTPIVKPPSLLQACPLLNLVVLYRR